MPGEQYRGVARNRWRTNLRGETLETPQIFELARGQRDRQLVRPMSGRAITAEDESPGQPSWAFDVNQTINPWARGHSRPPLTFFSLRGETLRSLLRRFSRAAFACGRYGCIPVDSPE